MFREWISTMFNPAFMDMLPLWAFAALLVATSFATIELGVWLGTRRRKAAEHEESGPVGTVVGATLGLLAFLLAFTFGIAASRFDTRKDLMLEDVNAIGTAHLRAGLLTEPHRAEARKLLREYVDIRADLVNAATRPNGLRDAVVKCETIQDSLWAKAEAATDRNSPIDALYLASLNDMFDLHTKRVVVSQYRIPGIVWDALAFVSGLTFVMVGFQFGLAGKRSIYASLALILTFSSVLILIRDLDNPMAGWLTVSQQPMIDFQKKLAAPGA